MNRKPIEIPLRPRTRAGSPVTQPPEQRQHRGLIFNDGKVMSGGRAHYGATNRDSMSNVGMSSTPRATLYTSGSSLRTVRPLPSSNCESPRRRAQSPTPLQKQTGRKYIAPQGSSNPVAHSSSRPSTPVASPARSRQPGVPPRDNIGADITPRHAESPHRGRFCQGAAPAFVPDPFKPRPYSPQLRSGSARRTDTSNLISFDPSNRETTPARAGRRVQAPTRTYDLISGKDF